MALSALYLLFSFIGVSILVALIPGKYLPELIQWSDRSLRAELQPPSFTVGVLTYLGKAAVGSAYGAAGS